MSNNPFAGLTLDTTNRGRWFLSILQQRLGMLPDTFNDAPLFVLPSMVSAAQEQQSTPYIYVELLDELPQYSGVSGRILKNAEQDFFVGFGVSPGATIQTISDNMLSDLLALVESLFGYSPIEAGLKAQQFTGNFGDKSTVAVNRVKFPDQSLRGYLPPVEGARAEMRVTGKLFYDQTPY